MARWSIVKVARFTEFWRIQLRSLRFVPQSSGIHANAWELALVSVYLCFERFGKFFEAF